MNILKKLQCSKYIYDLVYLKQDAMFYIFLFSYLGDNNKYNPILDQANPVHPDWAALDPKKYIKSVSIFPQKEKNCQFYKFT